MSAACLEACHALSMTVCILLCSIQALLSAPNPDDPLAENVAKHWKENEQEAVATGDVCTRSLNCQMPEGVQVASQCQWSINSMWGLCQVPVPAQQSRWIKNATVVAHHTALLPRMGHASLLGLLVKASDLAWRALQPRNGHGCMHHNREHPVSLPSALGQRRP